MVTTPALVLVLLAAPKPVAAPRVEIGHEVAVVAALPPVLGDEAVHRHLGSGLTTTLVLEVEIRGGSVGTLAGGAQVGVRWDLWDEKYLLTVTDLEGEKRFDLQGEESLLAWWSAATFAVAPAPRERTGPARASLRLTVLPFSRAEEEDTRAWFLRSLQRGGAEEPAPVESFRPTTTEPVRLSSGRQTGLSQVFNAAIATSIGRRSLLTYTWEVPVTGAGP
jgi:hypothetical protein